MATANNKKSTAKAGAMKINWGDTLRSPKGLAGFNYLVEPDTKFKPKHRIQLFLNKADPEVKPFLQRLLAEHNAALKEAKKPEVTAVPGLKKADAYMVEKFGEKLGIKEGDLLIEFTSNPRLVNEKNEKYYPALNVGDAIPVTMYNAQGKEDDSIRCFSGDEIRVSVRLGAYNTGKEVGCKAYLQGVQVITKKSGGGGKVNPFENESGEETPEGEPAPFGDEGAAATPAPASSKPKTKAQKPTAVESQDDADESEGSEGVDLEGL